MTVIFNSAPEEAEKGLHDVAWSKICDKGDYHGEITRIRRGRNRAGKTERDSCQYIQIKFIAG